MTRPSTEVEGIESAVSRSKGETDILCEIARTYNSSVPRSHRSHEQRNHLTTGTFNLLSKTESAFRLSGALQSNASSIRTTCPRNLCIPYGRFRRVETNLSNLPQLFTMCQQNQRILINPSDSGHFVIVRFGDCVISQLRNHKVAKSQNLDECRAA
jgi:hypothetical protein